MDKSSLNVVQTYELTVSNTKYKRIELNWMWVEWSIGSKGIQSNKHFEIPFELNSIEFSITL